MKRKLRLLLAMVLAMTMVMVLGIPSYAAFPEGTPTTVPTYAIVDGAVSYYLVMSNDLYYDGGQAYVAGRRFWKEGDGFGYVDQYAGEFPKTNFTTFVDPISAGGWYYMDPGRGGYCRCPIPTPPDDPKPSGSAHTHNFQWQTITEPTKDADGLEGEVCSCGATRNTQKLSAYGYSLNQYATPMINAAKAGQTITFEFGEWNSFPKAFMEKIAAKSMEGVTSVFNYKWNHVKQEITIPFGTAVDTNLDWYGPAKMAELYGAN